MVDEVKITEPVRVEPIDVSLRPTEREPTTDQALWVAIRNRTKAISFERYAAFVDRVFGHVEAGATGAIIHRPLVKAVSETFGTDAAKLLPREVERVCPSIHGTYAYSVLKLATEVFLILESGVVGTKEVSGETKSVILDPDLLNFDQERHLLGMAADTSAEDVKKKIEENLSAYFGGNKELPYLRHILNTLLGISAQEANTDEVEEKRTLVYRDLILRTRMNCPSLIELLHEYWLEEGMVAQTMGAIALRFQNKRSAADRDPLAQLEIDPLRGLNNLLWGYIQDEQHRLGVVRRAYEYDHHYGITLIGKAVPKLRSADSRSKFIDAFHNLLYRCRLFYREEAETTTIADGFPLLRALKEVHLVLSEGAHNQFGDLPWTARVEMLIEQWLLARPEMREFIRGRAMVPYKESWMGQVDAMKKLQNWSDVTITHFHELAAFGELILLSIRYGDWINVDNDLNAKNWARYFKPDIQGYIHAYRAVTGVDLEIEPVDTNAPWVHLKRQEQEKRGVRG